MKEIPSNLLLRRAAFMSFTEAGPTGCWVWRGYRNTKGYGKFMRHYAHRVSYALHVGCPKGLLVCHHCDNPPCVNPAHLYLGTAKDNTSDMMSKRRGNQVGLENKTCKVTEETLQELCRLYLASEPMASISSRLGLANRTVIKWLRHQGVYKDPGQMPALWQTNLD